MAPNRVFLCRSQKDGTVFPGGITADFRPRTVACLGVPSHLEHAMAMVWCHVAAHLKPLSLGSLLMSSYGPIRTECPKGFVKPQQYLFILEIKGGLLLF